MVWKSHEAPSTIGVQGEAERPLLKGPQKGLLYACGCAGDLQDVFQFGVLHRKHLEAF